MGSSVRFLMFMRFPVGWFGVIVIMKMAERRGTAGIRVIKNCCLLTVIGIALDMCLY